MSFTKGRKSYQSKWKIPSYKLRKDGGDLNKEERDVEYAQTHRPSVGRVLSVLEERTYNPEWHTGVRSDPRGG